MEKASNAERSAECRSTTQTPAKRAILGDNSLSLFSAFLEQTDIWVDNILPFVGIGRYIFVASACQRLRDMYKAFALSQTSLSRVRVTHRGVRKYRPTGATDTFFRAALSTVSCAKYSHCVSDEEDWKYTSHCEVAAKCGNLPVLQWARSKDFWWHFCTAEAARNGHLHVLKYAVARGAPLGPFLERDAAQSGSVEVIKWLHEEELIEVGSGTWAYAAAEGNLNIIKWGYENGLVEWREYTCENAARYGHLEVLKYVRSKGCPWDSLTCIHAAREGQLDVLQWARSNGCPWGVYSFRIAKNAELLKWLRANGCPWDCANVSLDFF